MKILITIISLLTLVSAVLGQRPNHGGHHHHNQPVPMTDAEFQPILKRIQDEAFDDDIMSYARGVSNNHYMLSRQIKQIVEEFSFKQNQEAFAKLAYARAYDQKNYYLVYEAFTFDTSKDEVSRWVNNQPVNDYDLKHKQFAFGGRGYYGPVPLSNEEFKGMFRSISDESFDDDKMIIAKQLVRNDYLYADQIKRIVAEFSFKQNQEMFAKHAYTRCYDQNNYYIVNDAFTFSFSKDELNKWLAGRPIEDFTQMYHRNDPPNPNPNNGGGNNNNNNNNNGNWWNNNNSNNNSNNSNNNNNNQQALGPSDFANVKSQLTALTSDNDRLARAKQITDQVYLTATQVKEIVEMFVFDDLRLEYAKYAYSKTVDPENYSLVKSAISNMNNKRDLDSYIQNLNGGNSNNNNNNNGNWNNNNGNNNSNNNNTGIQAMNMRAFSDAKAQLIPIPSDSQKAAEARKIVDANFLMTDQVKQIMELLIFEDERLNFAKYAYQKAFDPQNYPSLKALLSNESSQQALQDYIDNY